MSQNQPDNNERIQQHFYARVTNEVRIILEVWQRALVQEWTRRGAEVMQEAAERLVSHARRLQLDSYERICQQLLDCLNAIKEEKNRLNSQRIEEITHLMSSLSQAGLRQSDATGNGLAVPILRRSMYIALNNPEQAGQLSEQLAFFGLQSQFFTSTEELLIAVSSRKPPVIILEVDFGGPQAGLELAARIQESFDSTLPIIFYSKDEVSTQTRLAAVRSGGEGFFVGELEVSAMLELIESFSRTSHFAPYRVLVVDDSRAQSTFTERVLNGATIITRSINDPTLALAQMVDFQPDLIILDMYMPQCSGPELAKVIRQSERFVGMPIIYLSGEEDLGKQLSAMSEGADDFLTKPVMQHHLIATVRNRAVRARNLKSRMVRDSLTGLYSHSHILHLLDNACARAQKTGEPLSFVMLDIDFFKKVNDNFGHQMGDKVIKSLALFLQQRLRKTDHIGRYGGEEFALVLPNTSVENAARVVDSIRQRFAEIVFVAPEQNLSCTFSAGVAQYQPGQDAMQLSNLADEALYVAKNQGRNQVAISSGQSA